MNVMMLMGAFSLSPGDKVETTHGDYYVTAEQLNMAKIALICYLIYQVSMLTILRNLWNAIADGMHHLVKKWIRSYVGLWVLGWVVGYYANNKMGAVEEPSQNMRYGAITDVVFNIAFVAYVHDTYKVMEQLSGHGFQFG